MFCAAMLASKLHFFCFNFLDFSSFFFNSLKIINEVNLAPAVNKMLSNCDNIIQQHKQACLRVTSLLACNDILYLGTSAGTILRITQDIGKSTPMVTGKAHFSFD